MNTCRWAYAARVHAGPPAPPPRAETCPAVSRLVLPVKGVPLPRVSAKLRSATARLVPPANVCRQRACAHRCRLPAAVSTGPRRSGATRGKPSLANQRPATSIQPSPAGAVTSASAERVPRSPARVASVPPGPSRSRPRSCSTPPSAALPHAAPPPPGTTSTAASPSRGSLAQATQPPNGSLSGTPSRSSSVRLAPLGPSPRSETPWAVGLAARLSVRRNRLKAGSERSAPSSVRAGAAATSAPGRRRTVAGLSGPGWGRRAAVTTSGASCRAASAAPAAAGTAPSRKARRARIRASVPARAGAARVGFGAQNKRHPSRTHSRAPPSEALAKEERIGVCIQ